MLTRLNTLQKAESVDLKSGNSSEKTRTDNLRLTRRAALLSGLILPGLGQWLLGRRVKGCLTMLVFTALVVLLGARIFLLVHEAMFGGAMSAGGDWIAELHRRAYAENWWLLLPVLAIWVWSVIDAVRTGRRLEVTLKTGTEINDKMKNEDS